MPEWRNWQTRMVQDHVGASPWEFESPLRHHRKKGHRKVAFLLEKIRLELLRVGGWVRLGAVGQVDPYRNWSALEASEKGKDVVWRLHTLFM